MIVGTMFRNDDDMDLAWKQHDVYNQGLHVIVGTCQKLTRFAKILLEVDAHPEWEEVKLYDHRTLQWAHDLLAATWRFRHDPRQGILPFDWRDDGPIRKRVPNTLENMWLSWLREEVEAWHENPELVRCVQQILTNQNQPLGYLAEAKLGLSLLDRFSDVPWKRTIREEFEHDYNLYLEEVSALTAEAMSDEEESASLPCECTSKGKPACNFIPCKTMAARAAREGWGPLE